MDSSNHIDRAQNVTKECDITFPATRHGSSRRTPSVSSSSSFSSCSSSNFPDEFPSSPATPLRFSGVPFSWERLPGIPKMSSHDTSKKDQATLTNKVLPLPPQVSKRFNSDEIRIPKKISNERDPFFAALVECSKEEIGSKVSTSISDRFGFINLYTSCKRTCAVSESLVYIPRSSTSYDLITRQSR